jgi:hypothetical protein
MKRRNEILETLKAAARIQHETSKERGEIDCTAQTPCIFCHAVGEIVPPQELINVYEKENDMAKDEITTTDLTKFGSRERRMAADLLRASCDQGFPDDFNDDEVVVMMNTHSGNVFLTNSDYQVAMMNGEKLESFYTCPECGHEGFKEDMAHGEDNEECQRYLKDIS